ARSSIEVSPRKPCTWAHPVTPTGSRCRSSYPSTLAPNCSAKNGRSGRGPTNDMSPPQDLPQLRQLVETRANPIERNAPDIVGIGSIRRDAAFEEARQDGHFDVVAHRAAKRLDELRVSFTPEGDDHTPHLVARKDAIELVDVAEHGKGQVARDRIDEADRDGAVASILAQR